MYVEHFDAKTADEALSLLSEYKAEAKIVAGGTDLITLMKDRVMTPKVLVNIKTIPDLAYIEDSVEGLKIGALTTIHEIEKSPIIRATYPMLAEAAHSVGSPQLRNMGTIGGNICQDVRCWYYRRSPLTGRSFFCRRKGGRQCYAVAGENAYHAIIGGKKCFAVCPSDIAPALLALDAKVKIISPAKLREIPLDKVFAILGNTLKPNEVIAEIQLPAPKPGTKQRYIKFRLRKTIDFAISSVAAAITTTEGVVSNARIVLGAVAPTPYRAFRAEEIIKEKVITESLAETAAKAAVNEAVPLRMNAHKVAITESLVRRALLE